VTVRADLRGTALSDRVPNTCEDAALGCCDAWNRLAGRRQSVDLVRLAGHATDTQQNRSPRTGDSGTNGPDRG